MNYEEEIERRRHASIHDLFNEEVKTYSDVLNSLPPYNAKNIREEVESMDISIDPHKTEYDDLVITYAKLMQNRARITELINNVFPHSEIHTRAYKVLKVMAEGTFTGTAKDKAANAEIIVHPFHKLATKASVLLKLLEDYRNEITFASIQLSTLLKEKQSLAYKRNSIVEEGTGRDFERSGGNLETETEKIGGYYSRSSSYLTNDNEED